ncbi:MAG: YbhB/YbcL family Raf kinase inhibitor-like protein [Dehalococcoidia bacterium]
MAVNLSSPAFQEMETIPGKYTCDGDDISPQLNWDTIPEGTRSWALVMDDPDAPGGTFTHWVIFDLSPDLQELPENVPGYGEPLIGGRQGKNDFGRTGYGGPCPPAGKPHRYRFNLFALDLVTGLEIGISRQQLLAAIEGHVIDSAQLTGLYQR